MYQKRKVLSTILGVLVLAFTGAVYADDESKRLIAIIQGNANPVPTDDPCILVNTEIATGAAQSIGEITFESEEIVNFCSNPDPDRADIEGMFVITTTNGDQIFGGYKTVGHFDFTTNEINAFGRYRIKGGTGRFERARGKGVIAAAGSLLPPFEFIGALVGRISIRSGD